MVALAQDAPRVSPVNLPRLPRLRFRHITPLLGAAFALWVGPPLAVSIVDRITYLYEDSIGYDLVHNHTVNLNFEVAGKKYIVATPNIPLDAEQQRIWWQYVHRSGYPVYAADGPLTIDP